VKFLVCECGLALRIDDEPDAVEALFNGESHTCPRPGCEKPLVFSPLLDSESIPSLLVFDVTAREAFAAVNGLGLPCDHECGPLALARAFETPVKEVRSSRIHNSTRTVVHSILFADGTEMFFGSAPQGAVVYRITQPRSYTKEALDEQA
jgi:hypothetical protein